jgi:hypothetical protein
VKTRLVNRVSALMALSLLLLSFASPAFAVDPTPTDSTAGAEPGQGAQLAAPDSSSVMSSIQSGTLLQTRFGVNLALQSPWGGDPFYSFDWNSFKPTLNANTVDWIESDWYGDWSTTNASSHSDVRGIYPSGGEWYDVEAIYFDNDVDSFYIAIVTSVPPYKDWGGGHAGVGIYDTRVAGGYWVRPGDLVIDLGLPNTARQERYGIWHYNYGLDIVHDNRSHIEDPVNSMRDNAVGQLLYRTTSDAGGSDVENPSVGDWYTSGPSHNVTAGWEQTNFDPIYSGLTSLGSATVDYYRYDFPGGHLENGAETYVIEATIPRTLFGLNNPGDGDSVRIRWTEGCRNDGNSEDAVVYLDGDVDYPETGDAPDSTNHEDAPMSYAGGEHGIDAYFPTVSDTGTTGGGAPYGPCHLILPNGARLGDYVSAERDADLPPDQDSPNLPTNLVPLADMPDLDTDDGLLLPGSWQDGVQTSFQYTVTVPAGGVNRTRYVNVWFDWNRDGDWGDSGVACRTADLSADEHVVANHAVNVDLGDSVSFIQSITPCNPAQDNDAIWVRITLSDEPVETRNVRDEFNNFSFGNQDGTDNWTSNWREENEDGTSGPAGGEVRLDNGRLCIGHSSETPNPGPAARRQANLSGAVSATLSFDWQAITNASNDRLVVQVRKNNGNWYTLETFSGSGSGSRSYDISSYIDADTDIRFGTLSYYGGDSDFFCADNVQIAFTTGQEDGRGPGYCYADGETEDWYFAPKTPTGVGIASFDALVDAGAVVLTWETATEIDALGYNLERADSPNGPWTQLNAEMIASKGPGGLEGKTYDYPDTSVEEGLTYYYRLASVNTFGASSYSGPISVTVPAIGAPVAPRSPAALYRLYLPSVIR